MPSSSESLEFLITKASQLLSDDHGKDMEELRRLLESLKKQKFSQSSDLAKVENQIKTLMQEIENAKQREQQVQEEAQRRKEAEEEAKKLTQARKDRNTNMPSSSDDLVAVEIQIKTLMQEIENARQREQQVQDEVERRKEAEEAAKKSAQARKHNHIYRRGVVLVVVFLAFIIVVSLGVYYKYPFVKLEVTPSANQIVSRALALPPSPPSPTSTLPSTCDLRIISPSSGADITNYGAVIFQWTRVPAAINYSVEITPPQGWIVFEKGTSKTVYMENLPEGGEHQVEVNALDRDGKVLCTAMLTFNKAAFILSDNQKQDQEESQPQESQPPSQPAPTLRP